VRGRRRCSGSSTSSPRRPPSRARSSCTPAAWRRSTGWA